MIFVGIAHNGCAPHCQCPDILMEDHWKMEMEHFVPSSFCTWGCDRNIHIKMPGWSRGMSFEHEQNFQTSWISVCTIFYLDLLFIFIMVTRPFTRRSSLWWRHSLQTPSTFLHNTRPTFGYYRSSFFWVELEVLEKQLFLCGSETWWTSSLNRQTSLLNKSQHLHFDLHHTPTQVW